jgi:hypothetical protein
MGGRWEMRAKPSHLQPAPRSLAPSSAGTSLPRVFIRAEDTKYETVGRLLPDMIPVLRLRCVRQIRGTRARGHDSQPPRRCCSRPCHHTHHCPPRHRRCWPCCRCRCSQHLTGKTSAVITGRRQNGDKNNWKRRCVSTMTVMGDRWAAGGSNRLTSSWRVVLHINDAMCAGASEWRVIAPR